MVGRFGEFRRGLPVFLVTQHRPGDHGDFARQGDPGFLFACLLFATDSFVDSLCPGVVPERCPGTFNEDGSRQRVATFGDPSVAVGLAGLVLPRNESEVGGDLTTVFGSIGIVGAGNQDFCSSGADAWNGGQTLDAFVVLADRFEAFDNGVELFGE